MKAKKWSWNGTPTARNCETWYWMKCQIHPTAKHLAMPWELNNESKEMMIKRCTQIWKMTLPTLGELYHETKEMIMNRKTNCKQLWNMTLAMPGELNYESKNMMIKRTTNCTQLWHMTLTMPEELYYEIKKLWWNGVSTAHNHETRRCPR